MKHLNKAQLRILCAIHKNMDMKLLVRTYGCRRVKVVDKISERCEFF